MKKISLLAIQLICFFCATAQNSLSIKYRCIFNLTEAKEKDAELLIAGSKSMFRYITASTDNTIKNTQNDDSGNQTVSLKMTLTDSSGVRYYSDLQQNEIIARELMLYGGKNQVFIVKERIEPIQWEIKNEQKKVGKFTCQKAIGKFRGRIYTAWFTPEVPVHVGPWKLHGLPGSIVEVADEQKALLMQIQSISPALISSNKILPPNDGKETSFAEYFAIAQNMSSDFEKFVQAKMPRGAKFEVTSVKRNTLELTETSSEK